MRITLVAVLALSCAATVVAQHEGHAPGHVEMAGLFGPYPMTREASGTAWQPESAPMGGYHVNKGRWTLMVHGFADLVYDHQGGPRGETEFFGPNMGMLMAQRPIGPGTLGLRSMLSLDPATVGKSGYPLLLQTGETADGETPLIDRQHPHDFLMELAVSYSIPFKERGSAFAYFGLPGEPALGPPTFMHRFSGMDIPEAPITHHWLDATHITFGVATLGVAWRGLRLEGSSFTGQEPDQNRWGFDAPTFDSYSGRVSLNPTPHWALQISAGHLESPEQLEPGVDVDRVTASAMYHRSMNRGHWQTTLTWGRNHKRGEGLDGVLLESTWWNGGKHTVFARGEVVEKDELFEDEPLAHATFDVGKLSLGYIHELARASRVDIGVGGLVSFFHLPDDLRPAYGDSPASFMLFVRAIVR